MNFSTEHLENVFSNDTYDEFKNLLFDLVEGREIYDAESERVVSKAEANDEVRKICFEILGIQKGASKKERRRAMKKHGYELFEVIEEAIELKVETGFHESEFFNEFVEKRNLAEGDSNEFWTDENIILSVSKISGDHHDLSIQTLASGSAITVAVSTYGMKVGKDIDLFLTGRLDFNDFTSAVAKAFLVKVQNDVYAEVMNAAAKIPTNSQFNKTGKLETATKDKFDQLIEDVQTANECPVIVMGTKTALKKITALADVDWVDDKTKADVMALGRLGSYEGTALIEIPQRFKENDVTKKLVAADKLLIMPQVDNKFVKFIEGETEILEVSEKGETKDDMETYEIQRDMGVATIIGRYFGCWTITA